MASRAKHSSLTELLHLLLEIKTWPAIRTVTNMAVGGASALLVSLYKAVLSKEQAA